MQLPKAEGLSVGLLHAISISKLCSCLYVSLLGWWSFQSAWNNFFFFLSLLLLNTIPKDDLPETVRLTKQQVLRLLDQELTGQQHEQRNKKVAKKYRMVRFFGGSSIIVKSFVMELATGR